MINGRRHALLAWDREDFWKLLDERHYVPRMPTRLFVDEWCSRVLRADSASLRGTDSTRKLIFNREAQIKGALQPRESPLTRDVEW